MKKKGRRLIYIFSLICLAFLLCLIPLPRNYKDGGTVEWRAVLYSFIQWKKMDMQMYEMYKTDPEWKDYYQDGYWIKNDFYFFPENLKEHGFFE